MQQFTHLATFAPTGRGKGVGVLVPNLMTYGASCVVTDPKGELYAITAKHRYDRLGHNIYLFDPFGVCNVASDTFNPLDFIDASADDFLDQCRDLANMLVVRTGTEHEPHWNDSTELFLTGLIGFVCACEPDPAQRNLQLVREIASSPDRLAKALDAMQKTEGFGDVISRLGHQLTWFTGEELSSVLTTLHRHSAGLDSPVMATHTRQSSFDPRKLRSERATLYLCLPADRLETLAPLQRMWIGSLLRVLTRGQADERNPVLFFIDEAAHLGRIQALQDAVTLMRGMGIRLWFFFQSIGQLQTCYGEHAATFLDNIDTQQYFGTNAVESAEAISKRIGDATILIESLNKTTSRSRPDGHYGGHQQAGSYSTSASTTYFETGRRVFKLEEVLTLPDDFAFVFHRNLSVIPAKLSKYFEDPHFLRGTHAKARKRISAVTTILALIALIGLLVIAALPTPQSTPSAERAPVVSAPAVVTPAAERSNGSASRGFGLGAPYAHTEAPAPSPRPVRARTRKGESGFLIPIR